MQLMQLYILFSLFSISLVRAHFKVVYCYQCEDCDELNDCLLQPCPLILPTTTSTTTTARTTTTHLESTNTRPPTTLVPTFPPEPPHFETSTSTPGTTENIETSETAETSEIPETSESPETTEKTTKESSQEPSSTEDPDTLTHKRSDRSLTTDHSYKSVMVYPASVSHHCFKIDIIQNHKRKTNRGCVEVPEYLSGCGILRSQYGCSIKSCKVCSVDGCNNSSDFRYSLIVLVLTVGLSLMFEINVRI